MFSFFKKDNSNDQVPEWASFFTNKEYDCFMRELNTCLKQHSVAFEIQNGVVIADAQVFGFEKMGLTNISQACKQTGKLKRYRDVITGHFDAMVQAKQFDKEFKKIEDNFDEIRSYVAVRLYDHEFIESIGKENVIGSDFSGNLFALVVYDLPNSITSVERKQLGKWNKTDKELMDLGIKNISEKYPTRFKKQSMGTFDFWAAYEDHFFVPNLVFELEQHKKLVGSHGTLVGLPHRHMALFYPIESLQVVEAINKLIPMIYGINEEGPGSVSNQLFWYKNGVFTQVPYDMKEKTVQITPPDSFLEMLNTLPE